MSIRNKLLLAFGILGLLAGVIGFLAVEINSAIAHDVAQISHASIDEARAANGMSEALYDIEIGALRSGGSLDRKAADARQTEGAVARFEANLALFREATKDALDMAEAEKSPKEIAEAEKDARLLKETEEKFSRLKSVVLNDQNESPTAEARTSAASKLCEEILATVVAYRETTVKDLVGEIEAIEKAMRRANGILIGFTLAIILAGGAMTWLIAHTVSRPLTLLTKAAEQIARGHLDTKVDFQSKDEIGLLAKTFNQMTADLGATTVSRNYLDSILKSMANSLIVIDPDRAIQSVNEATLRLLGYAGSELIGRSMDDVLEDPQWRSSLVSDVALDREWRDGVETFYRTKTGESLPVTFSASTLRDSAGVVTGMVCVAQDISARKKAELELEQAGKKLLETSRQAGMAEVAASVLHNVGNVLNSVNVSGSMIANSIRTSKVSNLSQAMTLMREHAEDLPRFLTTDPKGRLLPGYLSDLAVHLAKEKEMLLQEIESLANNILHIKEIVGMQQNYARTSGIPEECDMVGLLENAVSIHDGALERHHIALVREYSDIPPVVTEKHKVLQILVNLIGNAKDAFSGPNESPKRITLRVGGGDGRVRVSVIDNGAGIPEENLTRIFSHGFTTKKEGHGFGLHSAALTAKELGGKLDVFSEGWGTGATFTLDLPVRCEEIAQ